MLFRTPGVDVVASDQCLEEESNERFKTGRYYPVNIGDIFSSKYQVVGKLGWGVTSTVWLARDLHIIDETLLTDFTTAEMKHPSPRKTIDGLPVYASRRFGVPKIHGVAVLSDFGSAVKGQDPDGSGYKTRAHLAEVIGFLGPPPLDLLKRGLRSREWFHEDGTWKAEVESPQGTSLENSEERLEGDNKWRPEDRKTAKELPEDPWLNAEN
ncbi:putative Serine/threonine-protein kinase spk-1 [Glarea lozoyensis 74030]|uniref:non-specific serine/threonine protein kinase n=1 Tax=Glarea lozoyensis (strain ATCC 74030 / MF5533) TaxID=1104152 RepID=H0EZH3_GLAL7|nr:putative Serine/threonine-protein kinase spk-1 [Glarea lozoyensis 74030]